MEKREIGNKNNVCPIAFFDTQKVPSSAKLIQSQVFYCTAVDILLKVSNQEKIINSVVDA